LPKSNAAIPAKRSPEFRHSVKESSGNKTGLIREVPTSIELERGFPNEKSKCIDLSKFKLHLHARVIKRKKPKESMEEQNKVRVQL